MKTKHFNLPQAKIMIAAAILCAPINMSAQESEKNSKEEGNRNVMLNAASADRKSVV